MKAYPISATAFDAIEGPRQLITHDHPRRFAALDLGDKELAFGISWRSDTIEPMVYESADGRVVWVGVDQRLAAVDAKHHRVRLSLGLNGNLLQLIVDPEIVIAVTETEALLFNTDLSIRCINGLPDFPDAVSIEPPHVVIRLVDGQVVKLDTVTGRRV
jgi:hypothetical protein